MNCDAGIKLVCNQQLAVYLYKMNYFTMLFKFIHILGIRMNAQAVSWCTVVKDYVALTKPRIISLLLFTTLVPMLIAGDGLISPWLVWWTLVGGALAAGGAGAINMYLDRDIDAMMSRTRQRPVPDQRVPPLNALIFGLVLNVLAFVVLYLHTNLLTAVLALIGTLYYVFVYTYWLKRNSPQNIVIGGAAGAIPPLVGWAAVTNQIGVEPLFLFAIIFYWTPPHFWALAVLKRTEYARAGIPMMPVVGGVAETKWQILLYTLLMLTLTLLLPPLGLAGPVYFVCAAALGGIFLWYAYRLFREEGTSSAWKLYKYSLLYLVLLFSALVLDHAVMQII
jgi:protoheme IX farnesyltransferase